MKRFPSPLPLLSGVLVAACSSPGPSTDGGMDAFADGTLQPVDAAAEAGVEGGCPVVVAPAPDEPTVRVTPWWAFEPWISKDISDTDDTYAFVDGFRSRDIPVGAVVIDSPWETQYHTFLPHPRRYPRFDRLVQDMHGRGVKVVLWITALVNRSSFDAEMGADPYDGPSPNFAEGLACGFYLNEGQTFPWWKGFGAAVDLSDPRARGWWHGFQDRALDLGIDGWKIDFGDSYVTSDPVRTRAGTQSHQAYSESIYRDFLAHGQARRGLGFTTMVRGWDRSYQFPGRTFARPEHAPVVWAGDNRRDWVGLADALDTMFRSARAGYAVVGSDIGGYLDRDDMQLTQLVPFDLAVFHRWIALGALTPFMQLHGRANMTPWTVPSDADRTTDIYRKWAAFHHALVPFFYALAAEANAGQRTSVIEPLGTESTWAQDGRFTVGNVLLAAPILDASGVRDVALPEGAAWFELAAPGRDPIAGGTVLRRVDATDPSVLPLYVRAGAIVPVQPDRTSSEWGGAVPDGRLAVMAWPRAQQDAIVIRDRDDALARVETQDLGDRVEVRVAAFPRPLVLRIRMSPPPARVEIGGRAVTAGTDDTTGWRYESDPKRATVVLQEASAAGTRTVVLYR